jgi:hypothetical protein
METWIWFGIAAAWLVAGTIASIRVSQARRRGIGAAPDDRGDRLVGGVWALVFALSFAGWVWLRMA